MAKNSVNTKALIIIHEAENIYPKYQSTTLIYICYQNDISLGKKKIYEYHFKAIN